MYKEFEFSKCRINSKSPTAITISFQSKMLSYIAGKTGKDITQLVEEYTRHKVEWDDEDEGLVLPFSTVNSLFAAGNFTNCYGHQASVKKARMSLY